MLPSFSLVLILVLTERLCSAAFTSGIQLERNSVPEVRDHRSALLSPSLLSPRSSATQLFTLKPSENGLTVSKNKMKYLRNKGKLDMYGDEGDQLVESCLDTGSDKNKHTEATDDALESSSHSISSSDYVKLLDSRPALVLNADYQPLSFIPLSLWCWQDSVKAVFSGRVTVVETYPDVTVRGIHMEMPLPSVIALNEFIPKASKTIPAFTRRNVFLRDGYKCQYCNKMFKGHELSLDHVIPRCRGGTLRWENTVSACRKCNGKKSDLMPNELNKIGMRLLNAPKIPSIYELNQRAGRILLPRNVHPTWAPYLGLDLGWNRSDRPKKGNNGRNTENGLLVE